MARILIVLLALLLLPAVHAALLSESAIGPEAGLNNSDLYESAVDAWYQPQYNLTQLITSGSCSTSAPCLWVPWYGSSSSCIATGENESGNLKTGTSCNSGEPINSTNNCMVSDEFSQVGLDLSMGRNQTRFQHFHNTVNIINSSRARIPAWRAYRSGNTIEACRSGVNTNCDTASDATARIIIAHWNAANNTYFTNQTQKNNYADLARNLTIAMVQSEITNTCKNSTLGNGQICWWLRAGNQSSLTSTDGAYTGYYADAQIALLQTCSQTRNLTYCAIAGNISLNYKQAAKWNGTTFTVPPGRSYKWDNFSSPSTPYANCTNTCGDSAVDGDETWDASDAVRAFFEGVAHYYDKYVLGTNVLPNSTSYMSQWVNAKMIGNLNSLPIQYYPNGNNSGSNQSGYVAQALQAAGLISTNNSTQVNTTVWNAMDHYSHTTKKWDSATCPGVYNTAFPIRMLGVAMGRDAVTFATNNTNNATTNTPPTVTASTITSTTNTSTSNLTLACTATDNENDPLTYRYQVFRNGIINQTGGTNNTICYQETANVSTSCGGLSTGTYAHTSGIYLMNYTKPTGANSATWQTKHGLQAWDGTTVTVTTYNTTIPASCFTAHNTTLELRFISNITGFTGISYGQCQNGTSWLNVTNVSNVTSGYGYNTGTYDNNPIDGDYTTNALGVSDWGTTCGVPNSQCDSGRSGANPSSEIAAALWEEAIYWNMTSAPNTSVIVGTIAASGLAKGQNWTLSCSANDTSTSSNWVNSTTFTIQNIPPNATNVQISAITGGVNCTFAFNDTDNDPQSGSSFRWFKNNTLLSPTSQTLGATNYTIGDQLTCEVTPSDGTSNGTRTNSSTYVVGDNTPPSITSITIPSTGTTSDILTLTTVCTDDNTIATGFPRVQWTNPNNQIEGNNTMSLTSNNTYTLAYTFNTVGTYRNFTVYCQDGNGNTATNQSTSTLSITTGGSTGSTGGSGGDSGTPTVDGCTFTILQPQEGTAATNPSCPSGGTSKPFPITIQNICTQTREFTITIPDEHCASAPNLLLAGNERGTFQLTGCTCPVSKDATEEFSVTVSQGAQTRSFMVRLSDNGVLGYLASPTTILIAVSILLTGLFISASLISIIAKR